MADAIEFRDGGTRVRVEGLSRVLRKLSNAGADAEDMRDLMHDLGGIVIDKAKPPTDSGQLAASLRAGRGRTKAVVRAGYESRVPYAGRIHYGDPVPGISAQPFLTDALTAARSEVFAALDRGIDALLKKNDLK